MHLVELLGSKEPKGQFVDGLQGRRRWLLTSKKCFSPLGRNWRPTLCQWGDADPWRPSGWATTHHHYNVASQQVDILQEWPVQNTVGPQGENACATCKGGGGLTDWSQFVLADYGWLWSMMDPRGPGVVQDWKGLGCVLYQLGHPPAGNECHGHPPKGLSVRKSWFYIW